MIAVKQLGYLVFEVSDLAAWEDFGTKILGLQLVDQRGDTGFSLRMDGYHQRFFIERGPADDLSHRVPQTKRHGGTSRLSSV
ncbi:MAG: VOC family protein [Deltaproteobacteria bacterium]|nr:VOC family protein [Deltaproteobacteria bacterium]